MLKLGCCTYNFRLWDFEEAMRFIHNMGFRYASVGALGPTAQVNVLSAARQPKKGRRWIKETADRYQLILAEMFMCGIFIDEKTKVTPCNLDAALRERMVEQSRRVCAFALNAGMMNVMGVPGDTMYEQADPREWAASVETLTRMKEIAAEEGAVFTVEPHKGSIIRTIGDAWQLLNDVPGLRYSLDYGQMTGLSIPLEEIVALNGRALNIHLKPARLGLTKCWMHEGDLDYEMIIRDLEERKWEGVVCIECIYDTDAPSFAQHPAFQNMLLTYEIERIMGGRGN